jgi:CubicO group peptidase (beta-lactamase class C family)
VAEDLMDEPGGHVVVDPAAAGLDRARLEGLVRRARREVDEGLLPSCQLALAHRGRLVVHRTIGVGPGARYLMYSCTKAITAAAVWRLLGEGEVVPDTPVAAVVPVFGANGKESVTVAHLLTHTAGFPNAPMADDEWADPPRRLDRLGSWTLDWAPGSRFVYHGSAAHWVLAQVVEVCTGNDFRDYVRTAVLDPLGLPDLQLGTPMTDQGNVLDVEVVGEPPTDDEIDALGTGGLDVSAIGTADRDLLRLNETSARAVGQPGGGAVGRAADLALFYQALLVDRAGLWDPAVLAAGTAEVHCGMVDPMTGAPANRTLGLVLAGDDGLAVMRGFGSANSPGAFGHMGAGGQVAWADPASGLSFAYLTNGLDRSPIRMGGRGLSLSTRAGRAAA